MIRSIHPLYLLAFMALFLLGVVWQNAKIENEISEELSERANAKVMAKRIVELKRVMRTENKGQIDAFLEGPLFSDTELAHSVKGERYVIDAKNMNPRQLQSFLNRILNMSVNVVKLKIDRKDDKQASLYMEISL